MNERIHPEATSQVVKEEPSKVTPSEAWNCVSEENQRIVVKSSPISVLPETMEQTPTTSSPGISESTAEESPQVDTTHGATTSIRLTNSNWFFKEEISVDMQEVNRRDREVSGLVPKKAEIKASEDGLTITVKGESKPISNFTVLSMGLLSEYSVTKNGEIVVITVCNKVTQSPSRQSKFSLQNLLPKQLKSTCPELLSAVLSSTKCSAVEKSQNWTVNISVWNSTRERKFSFSRIALRMVFYQNNIMPRRCDITMTRRFILRLS